MHTHEHTHTHTHTYTHSLTRTHACMLDKLLEALASGSVTFLHTNTRTRAHTNAHTHGRQVQLMPVEFMMMKTSGRHQSYIRYRNLKSV